MSGHTTVLAQPEPASCKLRPLGFFLAGFFAVWTLWALLLVRYPALNQGGVLRAVIRSGSLYAPLICHTLNNLVTSSMGL
jgi:hypothetical protein